MCYGIETQTLKHLPFTIGHLRVEDNALALEFLLCKQKTLRQTAMRLVTSCSLCTLFLSHYQIEQKIKEFIKVSLRNFH